MAGIAKVVRKFAKQTLVYWAKAGSDGFGKPAYADPVEIKCRWDDIQREMITAEGRSIITKAQLLLVSPVAPGGLVFLGLLTDWQALATYPKIPTVNQGGLEVMIAKNTPDLKARSFVYEAYL